MGDSRATGVTTTRDLLASLRLSLGRAIQADLLFNSDWRRIRYGRTVAPLNLTLLFGRAKILAHPDPTIRAVACRALEPLHGDLVNAAFCGLLGDPEPAIFRQVTAIISCRRLSPAVVGLVLRRIIPSLSRDRALRVVLLLPPDDQKVADQFLEMLPRMNNASLSWELARLPSPSSPTFRLVDDSIASVDAKYDFLKHVAIRAAATNSEATDRLWQHIRAQMPTPDVYSLLATALRRAEMPGSRTVAYAMRYSNNRDFISALLREVEAEPRRPAGFLWVLSVAPFTEAKLALITSLPVASHFERSIILHGLGLTRTKPDANLENSLIEAARTTTHPEVARAILTCVGPWLSPTSLHELLLELPCIEAGFAYLLEAQPAASQAQTFDALIKKLLGVPKREGDTESILLRCQRATAHLGRLHPAEQVAALEPLLLPAGKTWNRFPRCPVPFPVFAVCSLAPTSNAMADLLLRAAKPGNPPEFLHAAASGNSEDSCVVSAAIGALEEPLPDDADKWLKLVPVWKILPRFGQHPAILAKLLELARNQNPTVRRSALDHLARFADSRAFAEFILALFDQVAEIRDEARRLLENNPPILASQRSLVALHRPAARWRDIVDQIYLMISAGERTGESLLGKPVRIEIFRQGLGRTTRVATTEIAEISVNPTAIAEVHEHGEEICHGLVLHEIGHNLFDFPYANEPGIQNNAARMGVKSIYDLLLDERLERLLRAQVPGSGRSFDRLASYAFSQTTLALPLPDFARFSGLTEADARATVLSVDTPYRLLETAQEPHVQLTPVQFFALPKVDQPLLGFMHCLRSGFAPDLIADPRVRAALDLVPGSLRNMTHAEVLGLAKQIGTILGSDRSHQKALKRLMQIISGLEHSLHGLLQSLWRLAHSGMAPDNLEKVLPLLATQAPGIRAREHGPEAPESASRPPPESPMPMVMNRSADVTFDHLPHERTLEHQRNLHAKHVRAIAAQIHRLRPYFQSLNHGTHRETDLRRGHHLDSARLRTLAWKREFNLWVSETPKPNTDLHLSLLIDRSGSMAQSDKLERAISFAILVAECTKGIQGIDGHIYAFDDSTFWRLGDLKRPAASSLEAGGGNNDTGALWKTVELARQSSRKHKLVVMISDGMPTECSAASLKALVQELGKLPGLSLAQIAVDRLREVFFPHFVDLTAHTFDDAVTQFGRTVHKLIKQQARR